MEPIVETRSRSRSKTPGILLSAERENIKKIPNVSVIAEEAEILSQGTNRPKRIRKQIITSDYSSDDFSPDSSKAQRRSKDDEPLKKPAPKKAPEPAKNGSDKKEKAVVSSTTTTIVQTTTIKSVNGNEEKSVASESSTSETVKEVKEVKEQSQGIFDTVFNAIKTSTPIMYAKRAKRIVPAPEIVDNAPVPVVHLAYNEYKQAGEYWNKTPKTDYTYSELSPHRRELGKGVVSMPNMSRKSLDKYQTRVETMIHANPEQESFLRRRFLSNFTTSNTSRYTGAPDLNYDSQDEVDLSEFDRKWKKQKQQQGVIRTFFLMLINSFYSCVYSVRRVFSRNDQYLYTTPSKKQQSGIVSRSYEATKGFFLWAVSKFYLLVSQVLLWDTYLLRSNDGGLKKKRFLIGLLVLLPLLLLGAMLLTDDSHANHILSTKIPRTLSSVQNRLTGLFSWSNILAPFASITSIYGWLGNFSLPTFSSRHDSLHSNLKLSLDDNELKKLMAHIDGYIDTVISNKFVENNQIINNQFDEKLTITIANTINENLAAEKEQPHNNLDIDLIAEKVRDKLAGILNQLNDEEQQSQVLHRVLLKNDKFLAEVQKLVLHEHHKHNLVINNQPVDVDEIIRQVLGSEKLLVLIDGKLKDSLNRISLNDKKIEDIKLELSKLKVDLSTKISGFNDQFGTIRDDHKILIDDFDSFKLSNDVRLQQLLVDIDLKLKSTGDSYYASIDKSVRKKLVTILGIQPDGGAGDVNDGDLKSWIQNMFVAKEYLEMRLKELESKSNIAFKAEIDESGGIMMQKINDKIQEEMLLAVNLKSKHYEALGKLPGSIGIGLDVDEVRRIVKEVLAIYDADKTGLVDFALESAGGQVLSTRCTESYQMKSAEISIFGIPLWYPSNTPRTVISPSVQPGECWAFQGFPGFLVMQLNNKIYVTGFTLEHIPKSLSPNGQIDSAPHNFSAWGLTTELDPSPVLFGNYQYSAEETAPSLQFFPVKNKDITTSYQIVELRIESNHGNSRYTCLYRFRVHGSTIVSR